MKVSAESGQSLLEVVIALSAVGVVLGALLLITITGLNNNRFAQNQVKATKYAQETIDKIKSIRDRNGTVVLRVSGCENIKFSQLYSYRLHFENIVCAQNQGVCTTTSGVVGQGRGCYLALKSRSDLLEQTIYYLEEPSSGGQIEECISESNAQADCNSDSSSGFKRKIFITDKSLNNEYLKEKLITVSVSWEDASGLHESNLRTILTNK
ncbi:MAG: hypothetical protein Q7S88_00655 [Candidatus Daviesbacteria bacterium]|nr:hypothetical protein [Candidatus Daviesbacteria bacterium]